MDTCAKCGAALGVGRFCLNCGHRIGDASGAAVPMPEGGWTMTERPDELRVRQPSTQPRSTRTSFPARRRSAPSPDEPWLPGTPVTDDEPSRLHWGAWVLAAMALVTTALLALSLLGEDDPTATDESSRATAAAGDRAAGPGDRRKGGALLPPGPVVNLAREARVRAPATAPPTRDVNGKIVPYGARRMLDGSPRTAWRMPGDGTGTEIKLFFDGRAVVTQVGLVNGYAKRIGGIDWYPHNRRIQRATWTFDDGTSVEQVLQTRRGLQLIDVPPARTRSVVLTLDDVTVPGRGGLGRDYTAISTIAVKGKRAG